MATNKNPRLQGVWLASAIILLPNVQTSSLWTWSKSLTIWRSIEQVGTEICLYFYAWRRALSWNHSSY